MNRTINFNDLLKMQAALINTEYTPTDYIISPGSILNKEWKQYRIKDKIVRKVFAEEERKKNENKLG